MCSHLDRRPLPICRSFYRSWHGVWAWSGEVVNWICLERPNTLLDGGARKGVLLPHQRLKLYIRIVLLIQWSMKSHYRLNTHLEFKVGVLIWSGKCGQMTSLRELILEWWSRERWRDVSMTIWSKLRRSNGKRVMWVIHRRRKWWFRRSNWSEKWSGCGVHRNCDHHAHHLAVFLGTLSWLLCLYVPAPKFWQTLCWCCLSSFVSWGCLQWPINREACNTQACSRK